LVPLNKIYALLGGACTGKDTVRRMLLQLHPELVEATSHTTRPMRATENGSEYYFIDVDDFRNMYEAGEFVETRVYEVIGDEPGKTEIWYYGYSVDEVDKKLERGNILMIVDLQGFKEFKAIYGDRCVGIYIDVDRDLRVRRYLERDELNYKNVAECIRRIDDDDNRAFVGYEDWVDYVITSFNSEFTTRKIEKIIYGE
jgi:guanylate kinase